MSEDRVRIAAEGIVVLPDGAVTSAKIADGTITNSDISDSANISATKISGVAVVQSQYNFLNDKINNIVSGDLEISGVSEGVSVSDYGATGDGSTDDTAAIQAAIDAAGTGQRVFFPEGVYIISAPIRPKRSQILEGVYSNKYEAGEFPWGQTNGSIIRANPATFAGDSVVRSEPSAYGVTLSRLAIVGPGGNFASTVHGIYFGPSADGEGERAWVVQDCLINSCSGDGIAGHMWVFDARNVHISQCRAGIATFDDDGLLDARIIGCNIYFNREAGIRLAGGYSGAINIIGCRIERSGNLYGYPATPVNPNAPGIEITRAVKVLLSNIDTDSNTGSGLKIGNPDYFVYLITVTGCHFNRDGGGAQTGYESRLWVDTGTVDAPVWEYQVVADGTPGSEKVSTEGIPGIDLDDCASVRIVGSQVSYGAANDSEPDGILSPQYGIRYNESNNIEIIGTLCSTPVKEWSFKDEDTSYNVSIQAPTEHQLMTLPVAGEAKYLPTFGGIGSIAYQNDIQTIVFRNYNGDWLRAVTTDGVNPIRLSAIADLRETVPDGAGNSALRIVKGGTDDVEGYGLLRWTMGSNPESGGFTWFLGRYGDDGLGDQEAYIDSPIAVNYSTGRVDLNSTYQQSSDASGAVSITRGAVGQTGNLAEWWNSDADTLAGVTPDGRVFGSGATADDDYVTKAQLDAATTGGGAVSNIDLEGTPTDYVWLSFNSDGTKTWEVGVNPDASGNTFYIDRYAGGSYVDTPLAINKTTGLVETHRQYVASDAASASPMVVRGAASQTAHLQRWEANDGSLIAGVTNDGRAFGAEGTDPDDYVTKTQLDAVTGGDYLPLTGGSLTGNLTVGGTFQAAWGSGTYAAVQQGCTQVVRQGASPGNTMFAVYTSTANADADDSVFEVYGNGQVKITGGSALNEAVNVQQLNDAIAAAVESVSLPVNDIYSGSVLAFSPTRPVIIAENSAEDAWVAEAPDNVATVTVSFALNGNETLSTTHSIEVAPAEYSSATTAAVYGTTSSPPGIKFGTSADRCIIELDNDVYPTTDGVVLSVSGPAANAMGFVDGQESEIVDGEWLAVQDSDLPSISSLLSRIEALESSGGGGAALSSVRRRRSAYWYAGGPPGSVGTLVPVLGTAYALRMPDMGTGNIIDAVSVEISTALTAGNSGVVDFYIAAPHQSYEYPGVLGTRLVSYTFTSSDAVGRPTITASTPYVCAEDGDHWIIMVLRSGTSPTLRALQQNTTVGFGSDAPGTPGASTVGSPGYRDTAFPSDGSIEGGVTGWTSSVNPATAAPRLYWRMG